MKAIGIEKSLPGKVSRRVIPILIAAYVMAHLDRINVSFAALTMNQELGFSDSIYGLGASLFFLGYLLFEMPSNVLLQRYGARRLITTIMVIWGVLSASMALINTAGSLFILRFLLGIAESGLYPGVMLYITYWYAPQHRANAVAMFGLAIVIGGLIGGPLSGVILDNMDGFGGLSGWRWLFILEGLPTVALALLVWWRLDDRPEDARWLTNAEKTWLSDNLPPQQSTHPTWGQSFAQFREGRIWLLALIYLLFLGGLSGVLLWAPKILQDRLPELTNTSIGWVVGLSYLPFSLGMILWGRRSDRLGERFKHIMAAIGLSAVSIFVLLFATSLTANIVAMYLVMAGAGGALSTLWGMITEVLGQRLAAVGIAVVNSAGALGSFVTVTLLGLLRDSFGNYNFGIGILVISMALSIMAVWSVYRLYGADAVPSKSKPGSLGSG